MSQPEKSAVRILWQSTIRPWRVLFDDHDVADAQLRRRPVDGILKSSVHQQMPRMQVRPTADDTPILL